MKKKNTQTEEVQKLRWLLVDALEALREAKTVIELQNHGNCLNSVIEAIRELEEVDRF